jgi:hypothetical protein
MPEILLGLLGKFGEIEVKPVNRTGLSLPKSFQELREQADEANKSAYDVLGIGEQVKFFHPLDIWLFEQTKYGVVGSNGCAGIYPGRYIVDTKNQIQYSIYQPNISILSGIVTFTDLKTKVSQSIGVLNSYGRWAGPGGDGWDSLHYLVSGVLSFPTTSNLGALLAIYSSPPKLPFTESWQIPTFPTDSPEVKFPMSALFSFSKAFPRPFSMLFARVDVADSSPKTVKVSIWDANRNPMDSKTITLEGASSYDIKVPVRRIPASGYIEFTGVDMPEPGFTISDVKVL